MANALVADLPLPYRQAIADDVQCVEADDHHEGAIDIILVGPGASNPLYLAQTLARAHRSARVLIAAEPGAVGELSRHLLVTPFLPIDTRVVEARDPVSFREQLAVEVERGVRRQRHRQTLAALSARVRDDAERPADGPVTDLELFASLVASSDDAIITAGIDGVITSWNPAAAAIFGRSSAEMIGADLYPVFPEQREALERAVADLAAGLHPEPIESAAIGPGGRRTDLSLRLSPILAGAETIGISLIARDLTELRATQRALADRAAELARSNAELEQFAYVASHDLQEPLRMMASYSQLLLKRYGAVDERAGRYVHYIVDGAVRMQRLVADLLAYSRVGRHPTMSTSVDLSRVVQRVLRDMKASIAETGATVEVGDLPSVVGDEAQLGQLLQNLVSNAIKFRSSAPPRIAIEVEGDGDQAVIAVRDNGIGIDPAGAGRIFDMFGRLHGRDEYPGSGIGLALARRIVEAHGGQLWHEPVASGGTCFFVSLPAAREDG